MIPFSSPSIDLTGEMDNLDLPKRGRSNGAKSYSPAENEAIVSFLIENDSVAKDLRIRKREVIYDRLSEHLSLSFPRRKGSVLAEHFNDMVGKLRSAVHTLSKSGIHQPNIGNETPDEVNGKEWYAQELCKYLWDANISRGWWSQHLVQMIWEHCIARADDAKCITSSSGDISAMLNRKKNKMQQERDTKAQDLKRKREQEEEDAEEAREQKRAILDMQSKAFEYGVRQTAALEALVGVCRERENDGCSSNQNAEIQSMKTRQQALEDKVDMLRTAIDNKMNAILRAITEKK